MANRNNIEEVIKQLGKFAIHMMDLDGVVISAYHAFLGLLERLSGVGELGRGKALISSTMSGHVTAWTTNLPKTWRPQEFG